MKASNSIKNWLEDDKPREKMMQKGAGALTDAELLAILISSGTQDKSALDLAREILGMAGNNLGQLGRLTIKELKKAKGIGDARAIAICAAMELGRRRQLADGMQRAAIKKSRDAAEIFMPLLQDKSHECFYVMYLNQSQRVLATEEISSGGLTATVADVRIILKNALLQNANKIMIAHNHPSGSLTPSNQDKMLTQNVQASAALMDIKLLDHIIIAGNSYLSMADEGLL